MGLKVVVFIDEFNGETHFAQLAPTLAKRAKNVSKISAQLWSPRGKLCLSSPRAHRKTSSLVTSRREKKTLSLVTSRIAQREVTNDEVFL